MRFRAHETFFIRKGWIGKGIKNIEKQPDLFSSKDINPMDELGIGSNMVKSLRYWLQAVGITEENNSGKRKQTFTLLGELIRKNDRYIEDVGTLHLLHYKLINNEEGATAWYFFFNEFNVLEFGKADFVNLLVDYVTKNSDTISNALTTRQYEEDFNCIINTYLPRYKSNPEKVSPENNIDCPFGEIGLIDIVDKKNKIYKKSMPILSNIDPLIAMAIISDKSNDRTEINLNELLIGNGNIGKTFNLDAISMLELLYKVEKVGKIKIVRTAGLDVVRLLENKGFIEYVKDYYDKNKLNG